jgi:hypothetical protein
MGSCTASAVELLALQAGLARPGNPGPDERSWSGPAEAFEEAFHGIADLSDGGVEGGLIGARWLPVAAHLSHELQGRRGDLLAGSGLFRPAEYFDATAHTCHHYM